MSDFINTDTVAERLSVHRDTVRRMMKRRQIPYYRIERKILFRAAEVDECLRSKFKTETR